MERSRPSSGAFPSLKFWGAFDAAAACSWRRRRPSLSRLTGLSRRREEAIEVALRAKLAARAERRAKSSAAARKEIAEFTAEFLSAAREVFELMDEDDSGTLVVDEIVKAVDPKKGNKVANAASYNRANFNLRGLRGLCDRPSRHHFLSTRRKSSSSSRPAASRTCSF